MTTTQAYEPITSTINPFRYRRRATRVVMVGDVGVGGHNPIRVQSMTTTRTQDVAATAAQAERLVRAGCEIVRITAPTVRDARAIGEVRQILRARDIRVPLVADIHFSPEAAMAAAEYVEKVRINPGNYADSRKFAVREYSDAQYAAELERIEERVTPLILKLKERGIALRIGTNHGSLSDRIMNRYGDTPRGMVESALEFVRICRKNDFHDIILSMKASNPTVMVAAYRLLAAFMEREGMDYPFHLGVTEAGNGEDARIKSAAGIGALLLDGIGDTIRVSLAEEPEEEIPVARALAAMLPEALVQGGEEQGVSDPTSRPSWNPLDAARRRTRTIHVGATPVGGGEAVAVLTPSPAAAASLGATLAAGPRTLPLARAGAPRAPRPDAVTVDVTSEADLERLAGLAWKGPGAPRTAALARGDDPALLERALAYAEGAYLLLENGAEGVAPLAAAARAAGKAVIVESPSVGSLLAAAQAIQESGLHDAALALRADGPLAVLHGYRLLVATLDEAGLDLPLHLRFAGDEPLIPASAALGALLCDGLGDVAGVQDGAGNPLVPLTFNLLQATRRRITKTDYVACPSCGRTLFDLQSTTEKVKERTAHLVGVKIAIMGCVVNGPGEMADADFGYVGGAPGKVNLYVGKECVERNVPEEEAADRLVDLIKARGRWVEEGADQQL
jgi:(E)-4-hydroxy-3-methylbut-2-enyl-diphosphate synthase